MPAPKTTQVEPGSTSAVLKRGAEPGREPAGEQRGTLQGASGSIFARAICGITVYSANVEVPMKCRNGSPSSERRVVPSGR